ncbi:LLM class flavin-dependent oxidoreductase [Ktedonosporobacter rubrisoli]|uniref:LLM class flavin-dependent oxidoreductase n=1 Tax=Ktedonosporobacter rubrisoli TaxID=2509675 RepID=A0A4P6JQ57_KTERU|nr:LLM class flavin-dependent oxidoreductase [Ktedonosporobacter rubrisoli]QBD77529.1 LLM class flavin-dependent oxidoreductase [Ktedonosporobacter rubrisoli]
MRYGLLLPNFGNFSDARELAELAHQAEEAGWHGCFLYDTLHMGNQTLPACDPWIALTAVAMRTQHIPIGLMVAALPRRRPWKVARETVTLDHLSGGRLIMGAGVGASYDQGFTAFGEATDVKKRAQLLDESLAILQGLWSGQPFHYDGSCYHVEEITFLPPPVRAPHIPLWIAGLWPKKGPMERSVRFDGVYPIVLDAAGVPDSRLAPSTIKDIKRFVQDRRAPGSPFDIVTGGDVFDALTHPQAQATLAAQAEAGATWCLEVVEAGQEVESVRSSILRGVSTLP